MRSIIKDQLKVTNLKNKKKDDAYSELTENPILAYGFANALHQAT